VKISIPRLALAAAGLAVATGFFMTFAPTASEAALWGHAKWCAVTDNGSGDLMWECVYDTVEECQPFILAGNRGSCNLNPYWKGQNQPHTDDDD
jgi:hypothetical protein